MKQTVLFLLLVFLLDGCQSDYKIDDTDILKFGEALDLAFKDNNDAILRAICQDKMILLDTAQQNKIRDIKRFYDQSVNLIEIQSPPSPFQFSTDEYLYLYYKKGESYYCIDATCEKGPTGHFKVVMLGLSNLSSLCEQSKSAPFENRGYIKFSKFQYSVSFFGNSLNAVRLKIQNFTPKEVTYIKLKLIIRKVTNGTLDETFFNRTVEFYPNIPAGDIVQVDIPGIEGYSTNFKITGKNIYIDAELLDLQPNPQLLWCDVIQDLEQKMIKKDLKP